MNTSQLLSNTGLQAMQALFNGGTLNFYSGIIPSSPEATLSGNTLLATFTFGATAFGAPAFTSGSEQSAASFTASSITPTVSGITTFARALKSDGVTVLADFIVTAPWAPSLTVVVGQMVTAGGNSYVCTTAGTTAATGSGPTGTGTGIADGTAVWSYSATPGDAQLNNATLQSGVAFSLTSCTISLGAD